MNSSVSTERVRASRARRSDAGFRRIEVWINRADLDAGMAAAAAGQPLQVPPGLHAMSWAIGWTRGADQRLGPSLGSNANSENREI